MDKEFTKKLIKLVIPITIQQIMVTLVSVSDVVMLGFLNQDSLSAVSLAGQVQFVFSLFIFSVTGGITVHDVSCTFEFLAVYKFL